MKFSASRRALLDQCNWAFHDDFQESLSGKQDPSEALKIGIQTHDLIASFLRHHGPASEETNESALPYFCSWLEWWKENLSQAGSQLSAIHVEEAYALDIRPGYLSARVLPSKSHRDYSDLRSSEIAGTLDFAARTSDGTYSLLDWKVRSPGNFHDLKNPKAQVETLASMFMLAHDIGRHEPGMLVGYLTIHEKSCELVQWRFSRDEAEDNVTRLVSALQAPRELVTGIECVHCPARKTCPAFKSSDQEFESLLENDVLSADVIARGYSHLRVWEERIKGAREHMKLELERLGGSVSLGPGRNLVIEDQERDSLGKASILEGYGKTDGLILLEQLRDRGALRSSTSKVMVERNLTNKGRK